MEQGRIQIERYHLHVLKTIQEAKHAIHYVLFNQQKHEKGVYTQINEYSSVLFLAEGLPLIRSFVRVNRIAINIHRGSAWKCDSPLSWLASRGLSIISTAQGKFSRGNPWSSQLG